MADYQYDPSWNTYRLEPDAQDLSLSHVHGQAAANVEGNARDNVLTGNDAGNVLNGNQGADTLIGGLGDDQYFVHDAGDAVIETEAAGHDEIIAYISYTLPEWVEVLGLLGYDPIDGTGNDLNNILIGSLADNLLQGGTGDDRLFGRGGSDTLIGGAGLDSLWGDEGDDTFIIDEGDEITEDADSGNDWVVAPIRYTLGAHLENLRLGGTSPLVGIGNSLDNHLIGGQGDDTLQGHGGHDTIEGGAGADSLEGGFGDDVYRIDDAGDLVVETDAGGNDRVETLVSASLTAFVEDLIAAGSAAVSLTGNALDNAITGNAAANILDGGAGADRLLGGHGSDTYIVDRGDRVTELAGEGTDTVLTGASWTLGEHLENLTATGSSAAVLTGNALGNILTGNAAANVIDGGAGADRMHGGSGNDTFSVDNRGDTIIELARGGTDQVIVSVSYALGPSSSAQIEKLTAAAGRADLALTGNKYANAITGNSGANKLSGGSGNDQLKGGAGRDTFVFSTKLNKSRNVDKIQDFSAASDSIWLENKIFTALGPGSSRGKAFKSDMFVEGTRAQDAEDRIIYDRRKGYLYYDGDGTGGSTRVKIATISNKAKLSWHDFYVV
jgi:serralysin